MIVIAKISKLAFVVSVAALAALTACSSDQPPASPKEEAPAAEPEPAKPTGTPFAVVETNRGDFTIELLAETAPQHVENFIELADSGFWYNTLFHRVLPGTMIQGGDPNSKDNNPYNDGQGSSGKFLKAEFSKVPFERGTVAMARNPRDVNTASSQFFICLKRMPEWDGDYTVFGKVVDGIELVDKLSHSPVSKDRRLDHYPTGKIIIKRVKIEYREKAPTGS